MRAGAAGQGPLRTGAARAGRTRTRPVLSFADRLALAGGAGNAPSRPARGGRGRSSRRATPASGARRWWCRFATRVGAGSPDHSRKRVHHENVEHREDQQTVRQRDVDEQPELKGALEGGLIVQVVLGLDEDDDVPLISRSWSFMYRTGPGRGQEGPAPVRLACSRWPQKFRRPAKKGFNRAA